jgi:hypothetical protein
MTQLTPGLASTHDHWFEAPAGEHALAACRLRLRHSAKRHPVVVDGLEWAFSGLIAAALLAGTLIASA